MDARHRIGIIATAAGLAVATLGGRAAATLPPPPPAPDEVTNSFIDAVNDQFGEPPQDVECVQALVVGYDCTARLSDGSLLSGSSLGPPSNDWGTIERIMVPDTDLGRAVGDCLDNRDIPDSVTFYDGGLSLRVEAREAEGCIIETLGIPEWVGHVDFIGVLRFGDWSVLRQPPGESGLGDLLIMSNEVAPDN